MIELKNYLQIMEELVLSKKILLVGDIHGDLNSWLKLINDDKEYDLTIQVGDFGAGFVEIPDENAVDLKHKFIRGNHDDPQKCKESARWIPDGTYWPEYGMMFIGGAWSIDKDFRTVGVDWWEDEELSYQELNNMINLYLQYKPRMMITHDCPHSIAEKLFKGLGGYPISPTRTSYAFDVMLKEHRPETWAFGHWHDFKNCVIDNTRFICCDINQGIEIQFTEGENYE